jgi:glycosyltransferase involved in cell wall biosynthesis
LARLANVTERPERHVRRASVWIVNHYASQPDQPAGGRHFNLARELVQRGHRVTIFAAGRNHLTGLDEHVGGRRLLRTQSIDGVEFAWLRTASYAGNSSRRVLNMLSFVAVFLVAQVRFRRPDIVIGSTVHPFAAFGAWVAACLRGARFVFEIRDLWPQTLVDLGAMRLGSPGERLLRALEAFLVRRATVVITLLPGIRDYLASRGLPADRVVYIPNGVDLTAFDPSGAPGTVPASATLDACLSAIDRLRREGRFVLGYTGTFGRVNRVDVIARAAALAEERRPGRIGVVLVGDGPERAALEQAFGGVATVAFCPAVPKREIPAILGRLDATVVHTTATPVYRFGISFHKLFDYMAAAKPVVFATESAYDPVAATGAGLSLLPDDPSALADAFLALADRPDAELVAMGQAGEAYVRREHNIAILGETLAAVVEGRAPTPVAAGRAAPD